MKTTIRPLQAADEAEFIAAARSSRALHKPWVTAPCDPAAFEAYLGRFASPSNLGFVVVEGGEGKIVGAVNVTNIVWGLFCSAYLGYFAFAGHERQGHMTRGLKAVVRHAFLERGLHRLEANIQPANVASIALVRACGFALEGYSPAYLKIGGRWRDHERWALIRR